MNEKKRENLESAFFFGEAAAMDSIGFRPVEPEDEAFLCRLYASTRREEMAQLDWGEAQKEEFLRMQFKAQSQYYDEQYRGDSFLVIRLGETPIGRLYVGRWIEEMRIIDIALLPEHRNRGIGGMILKDLMQEAAGEGKPVRIHVEKFNPAHRLYERLGFTVIEDKGVYDFMEWTADCPS